jgi:AcrR family transcriptional regulator
MLGMPHPARISQERILQTARRVLERHGPAGLAMRALARELEVSAPSLYFYVESREDLLSQLIAVGLQEFGAMMREAAKMPGDLRQRVGALGDAYVTFAEANPQLFTLVFGPCVDEDPSQMAEEAAAPVLALAAEVAGEGHALFVSEALWSLAHGYTMLRLADQFRMNPQHEAGFEFSLDILLEGARRLAATPL